MKPVTTWIVIADGARAQVFENKGPGKGLAHLDKLAAFQKPLRAGDITSDRPGRAFSSAGHGRSAMEPSTDPVAQREAEFIAAFAKTLGQQAQAGNFDRLIIAAAPQALGDFRAALSSEVSAKITAELPKDLTKIPFAELPAHFAGVIAL